MKTVLIAEDNELLANLWKNALSALQCTVHIARDGEEALKIASRTHPDLIVMDIMMPKVDGLEATRRILELRASDPPQVLFVSCLARSADVAEAQKLRAADFLVKGRFSVQTLVDRVCRLLDDRTPSSPSAAGPTLCSGNGRSSLPDRATA